MSDFVILQNLSGDPQKAYAEGETFNFAPRGTHGSQQPATASEAEELLENYPFLAVVTKDNRAQDRVQVAKVDEVWVANMTGNPDAPECVDGWVVDASGRFVRQAGADPYAAKHPRDLIAHNVGRKESHEFKDGIYLTKTIAGREERIEPYSRIKLRAHEARTFTDPESRLAAEHQGAVMESRAPAEFEPTYDWPLNQKRLYLEMLPEAGPLYPAGRLVLGESEEEIRERLAGDKKAIARALFDADELCWKRIQLRLMHPAIPLPSKSAFEKFAAKRLPSAKKQKAQPTPAQSDVADLVAQIGS